MKGCAFIWLRRTVGWASVFLPAMMAVGLASCGRDDDQQKPADVAPAQARAADSSSSEGRRRSSDAFMAPEFYGLYAFDSGRTTELVPCAVWPSFSPTIELVVFDKAVLGGLGQKILLQRLDPEPAALIDTRTKPVPAQPDMFRLVPVAPLGPGVYQLKVEQMDNKRLRKFFVDRDRYEQAQVEQCIEVLREYQAAGNTSATRPASEARAIERALDVLKRLGSKSGAARPILVQLTIDGDKSAPLALRSIGLDGSGEAAMVKAATSAPRMGQPGRDLFLYLSLLGIRRVESVTSLGELLKDADPDVRSGAVFALGAAREAASKGASDLLRSAAGDDNPDVREGALRHLVALATREHAVDEQTIALLQQHLVDPSPKVRAVDEGLLGALSPDSPGWLAVLEEAMRGPTAPDLFLSLAAIGPRASALAPLIRPYLHSKGMVSLYAAYSLWRLDPGTTHEIATMVVKQLRERGDKDTPMRIICELGPVAQAAILDLIRILEGASDGFVVDRRIAAAAMGRIGVASDEVIRSLSTVLESDDDEQVRITAEQALQQLQGQKH